MAVFKSDQITNIDSVPVKKLKPSDLAGRVRTAYFSYTTPAAGAPAVADLVILTKVPADARILDMLLVWEALSSGAGAAGADLGLATDNAGTGFVADFAAALSLDAAGVKRLDPVIDKLPTAAPASTERFVVAKVTGEAWAASKKVQGWVEYVVD